MPSNDANSAAPNEGGGPTDADLRQFGYAPGGYIITCRTCEEKTSPGEWCDKRATCCRPCAVTRWNNQRAAPVPLAGEGEKDLGRLGQSPSRGSQSDREPSDEELLHAVKWREGIYDGKPLTRRQIIAELHDYRMILAEVPLVYDHVTGGRISKPNTSARAVIAVADDHLTELVEEEVKERLERAHSAGEPREGEASAPPNHIKSPSPSEHEGGSETILTGLDIMAWTIREDIRFAEKSERATPLTDDSFIIPRHWMPHRVARRWIENLDEAAALIRRLAGERDEARVDTDARWFIRMAEIRESSGVGHKPMLSDVPEAIRDRISSLQSQVDGLRKAVEEIATHGGDTQPDGPEYDCGNPYDVAYAAQREEAWAIGQIARRALASLQQGSE